MIAKPLGHLVWIALLWGALTGLWAEVVVGFVAGFVAVFIISVIFD